MTRSKSIIGALVLCALSLCAFGAANASAAIGLTAVECAEVGETSGKFNNSHCETPESPGAFETVAFTLNESKEIEGDAVGMTTLHMRSGLTETTVTCGKAHLTGKVTNVTPEGNTKEMQAHGTETVITYEECEAHLQSRTAAEEACKVEGISGGVGVGKIQMGKITATTGPEHKITYKPESGSTFTEFNILPIKATTQACVLPNAKVVLVGEIIAQVSTERHSHVTFAGEGAIKVGGGSTATLTGTIVTYTKGNPERTVGLTTVE